MAYFEPWKGSDYESGGIFNYRILALGESHHCNDVCRYKKTCGVSGGKFKNKCHSFTTDRVKEFLNGGGGGHWGNTYMKFTRVLTGGRDNPFELRPVWNSIAFYNFLQTGFINSPREAIGDNSVFAKSLPYFESVVAELQPDFIIVWGNRVWNTIKDSYYVDKLNFLESDASPSSLRKPIKEVNNKKIFVNIFKENPFRITSYEPDNGAPIIMKITHPSSSKFAYSKLTPLFTDFLKPTL